MCNLGLSIRRLSTCRPTTYQNVVLLGGRLCPHCALDCIRTFPVLGRRSVQSQHLFHSRWNLFNKCPSDYKDTQLYKDEIDDILKSLGGHYEKPEDNTKISVTLGNDDNGFRIDYEYHYVGSAFISGFNYVDTTIKWLIKDGQAVYGTAEDYPWKFTVTPSENSMTIEGDYEELNGTYTKTRDF